MSITDAVTTPAVSDGSSSPQLDIDIDIVAARATLAGELDLGTADALRSAATLLAATGRHVTIDLGGLRFIDAAGLGEIVRIQATLTESDRHLTLSGPSAKIERTFAIAGLAEMLRARPTDTSERQCRPPVPRSQLPGGKLQ